MEYLVHQADVIIDRDCAIYPASAVVFTCDGDFLWRFDEDWTDDEIKVAIDFANRAYDKGHVMGKAMKLREVQSALGIQALIAEATTATDESEA